MVEQLQNGMFRSRFAVDEKPYCAWEWDLPDRNLSFLNGIDPACMGRVRLFVPSRETSVRSRRCASGTRFRRH